MPYVLPVDVPAIRAQIVTLGELAVKLKATYDAGDTHAAERLALEMDDQAASLRHRLLDQLHAEWQSNPAARAAVHFPDVP